MLNAIDPGSSSCRGEHDSTCIRNLGLQACCVTLAVEGPLHDAGVEQVCERLLAVAGSARVGLFIDMSQVDVIGASGLELLIEVATLLQSGGLDLTLTGCKADVADLIGLVVPAGLLTMSDDEESALLDLPAGVPAATNEESQHGEQPCDVRQDEATLRAIPRPTRPTAGGSLRVAL